MPWVPGTIEQTLEELGTCANIPLPLEIVMDMLQQLLGVSQFRWFHPSDLQIVARSPFTETIVRFEVTWVAEDVVTLAIASRAGPGGDDITPLIEEIAEVLMVRMGGCSEL
jgi:hypothetical protein